MDNSTEELHSIFLTSLIAGGLAGCAVDFVLFPLDSFKTRVQAVIQGKKVTWKSPYKGLTASLASSFPCAATFWATYTTMKRVVDLSGIEPFPAFKHLISAACSSVTTSMVRTPFEVIKQQLQMGMHANPMDALFKIAGKEGISGLWRGAKSLIMREIPFDAIQFLIYEYLKHEDYGGSELSLLTNIRNGAIAGCIAAFVTTPIDVAKTRLMVNVEGGVQKDVRQTLTDIYAREGISGLWRGWKPRCLFTTVGGMLFFGTYELVQSWLTDNKI
jgi:solute carrier family 25 S-adenosylmethionine transporter 26